MQSFDRETRRKTPLATLRYRTGRLVAGSSGHDTELPGFIKSGQRLLVWEGHALPC